MSEEFAALERLMSRVDRALAGRMSDAENAEMRKHFHECRACEEEIERARLIRALLQNSCAQQAPDSLRQRIEIVRRDYCETDGYSSYTETTFTVRRNPR